MLRTILPLYKYILRKEQLSTPLLYALGTDKSADDPNHASTIFIQIYEPTTSGFSF